jgi:hypothetical protein
MAGKVSTRLATNLLGRIITKNFAVTAGDPMWPVDDAGFSPPYPQDHKAEIVAVWLDESGDLKLGCRTLYHGLVFTVYAVHGHTIDIGK